MLKKVNVRDEWLCHAHPPVRHSRSCWINAIFRGLLDMDWRMLLYMYKMVPRALRAPGQGFLRLGYLRLDINCPEL